LIAIAYKVLVRPEDPDPCGGSLKRVFLRLREWTELLKVTDQRMRYGFNAFLPEQRWLRQLLSRYQFLIVGRTAGVGNPTRENRHKAHKDKDRLRFSLFAAALNPIS
jgi:hypothetical protein